MPSPAEETNISDEESQESTGEVEDRECTDEKRIRLSKKFIQDVARDSTEDVLAKKVATPTESRARFADALAARLEQPDAEGAQTSPTFLRGHKLTCTSVCTDSSTRHVYSGGKDCALVQWDVKTGSKVVFAGQRNNFDCNGHTDHVLSLAFHDSSGLVVSAGGDRTVRLWDPRKDCKREGCVDVLKGHTDKITSVCCNTGDGKGGSVTDTMFTAGLDKTVKVWDLRQRRYMDTLLGHTDGITDMDICSTGRPVTGSVDKTTRMWKVSLIWLCMRLFLGALISYFSVRRVRTFSARINH